MLEKRFIGCMKCKSGRWVAGKAFHRVDEVQIGEMGCWKSVSSGG
ncbi:hypothetical protein [Lysinibacillus yapensis]|nr:hypothetical protein [Lysinibacillus yapensis]